MPEGRGSTVSWPFCLSERSDSSRVHFGEEWRLIFLSTDNEASLAWLADALRRPRPGGRTKTVGYLEAVLEEVVFEAMMAPIAHRPAPRGRGLCPLLRPSGLVGPSTGPNPLPGNR